MKTMNCTDFKNLIDDYCDSELNEELTARCDLHLSSCADCTELLDAQNQLLASLKAMPVAGPSEGFEERALQVAKEQGSSDKQNHHRRGFMVGFGTAAAAALAMWVVVGINPSSTSDSNGSVELANVEENVPEFSIALNEQRDIKLAFYSSTELTGAQITLQMPENVALVGFPGQRELAWKANLVKGDNLLRLPVIATSSKGGQLVAQIEYMGKVKTLKVNFAVGAAGVSGSAGSKLRIV
jgi:hypothetical protein